MTPNEIEIEDIEFSDGLLKTLELYEAAVNGDQAALAEIGNILGVQDFSRHFS